MKPSRRGAAPLQTARAHIGEQLPALVATALEDTPESPWRTPVAELAASIDKAAPEA